MYENIVVGTDGSETANGAVQRAADLAQTFGATVHVVYAYQPLTHTHLAAAGASLDIQRVNDDIAEGARAVCREAVRGIQANVEVHAVPGDPADVLVEITRDLHADLLVVGNRGMSGKRRFVLGSVPNKVSHHAPCDILIVDTSEPRA